MKDATDCLGLLPGKNLSKLKNLGVIFESELKFDRQINAVVKNSFFHLRSISKLKFFLRIWRQLCMLLCHLVWIIVMHCIWV